MSSLDDDSLFTNIPLDETFDICTNTIYIQQNGIESINEAFSEVLYKQKDGATMGSPLGPNLANSFLCFYERKSLEKCPLDLTLD